jgi:pimeloyl-ACP methyl ester carboxylesterase
MADVVLIHGGGMGAWVWDDLLAELHKQAHQEIRCLAVEVPGCGAKRGRDIASLDNRDIAGELVDEIVAAGIRNATLVGHSQAGQLIPFVALHSPGLVDRLIYVSCSAPLPGRSILDTMGNGLQGSRDDQVGWPVDEVKTPLPGLFRAMFCNDMPPGHQEDFLARLGADTWPPATYTYVDWAYDHLGSMPATYVVCEQDQVLPPAWQRRFADILHVDRTVTVDAGHQVMNSRPAELAAIMLAEISRTAYPSLR